MKAAATPAQATMTPPTAGPKLRAMLKLTLFNAIALGSSAGVTCSPTDACHEGPNRAIPLPTRKVNRRRLAGPTWPPNTAIDKRIEPTSEAMIATTMTRRRSEITAIRTAGRAKRVLTSEERRVGEEGGRKGRDRGTRTHK